MDQVGVSCRVTHSQEFSVAGCFTRTDFETMSSSTANQKLLASLGRRRYVSESALAELLKEVKEVGMPDASSRSSIKRARKAVIDEIQTEFGPLIQSFEVPLEGGGTDKFDFIHPGALVSHALRNIPAYRDFVKERLQACPCSVDNKWRIITYEDEVVIGNTLKSNNKRKCQAMYWSFFEHGFMGLSSEFLWFPLVVGRSHRVAKIISGMTALIKEALLQFVSDDCNFTDIGISVGCIVILATLTANCADAAALKMLCEFKGGGNANFPCLCCGNVVSLASEIADFGPAGSSYVPLTELAINKFKLRTTATALERLRILARMKNTIGPTAFAALETKLSINYLENGILNCPRLLKYFDPVEAQMYDWMHCYIVNGIFNKELACLLKILKESSLHVTAGELHEFLSGFVWPLQYGGNSGSGKNIFEKAADDDGSSVSCSASDALGAYPILRVVLTLKVVSKTTDQRVKDACVSFFCLCDVLDALQSTSAGLVTPEDLHKLIVRHLTAVLSVHGEEIWTPKFHFVLHLAMQFRRFRTLFSCFVHERRHKQIKRPETDAKNTSGEWEKELLRDLLYQQLLHLGFEETYPAQRSCLLSPRLVKGALKAEVQEVLLYNLLYIYLSCE